MKNAASAAATTKSLLYSSAQIRLLEQQAIAELKQGDFVLMQRAASALLTLLKQRWPSRRQLLIYVGAGNNGGDGYLLAAYAKSEGYQVALKCIGDHRKLPRAAAMAAKAADKAQITRLPLDQPTTAELIVDALFGIGLNRTVAGDYAQAITQINQAAAPVLAVDVPSGLCADTGRVFGAAVKADVTLSFIGQKMGLFTADGPDHSGELLLNTLDCPAHLFASIKASASLAQGKALLASLLPRPHNFHKGKSGHVLVIGGDHGMAGAPLLAAEAALRCGAGLVTVLTRPEHKMALLSRRPELMVHGIEPQQTIHRWLTKASMVVIGPGLGQQFWGQQLLQQVLQHDGPLLLDADALNLIAQQPSVQLPAETILTPHPAEAARLLSSTTSAVQDDRFKAVLALQKHYQATVLLKGNGSLIADTTGVIQLVHAGNPGMATAGMGDLLCGVIAALSAQGLDAATATALGGWLHAAAADQQVSRYGERGLLASDLLPSIRQLLNSII